MTSRTPGRWRGIDAAYAANCACASGVVGVTLLNEYTATIGLIPFVAAAITAVSSAASSAGGGASSGGVQTVPSTIARYPARRASSILASAEPDLAASSTAPTTNVSGVGSDRPQPVAATASTETRARRAARDDMSPQLLPPCAWLAADARCGRAVGCRCRADKRGWETAAPMRARGLEPPRAEAQRDLNPPRLPIPPHPRGVDGMLTRIVPLARSRQTIDQANGRAGVRRFRAPSRRRARRER